MVLPSRLCCTNPAIANVCPSRMSTSVVTVVALMLGDPVVPITGPRVLCVAYNVKRMRSRSVMIGVKVSVMPNGT